jgi:hypothetical protein
MAIFTHVQVETLDVHRAAGDQLYAPRGCVLSSLLRDYGVGT